MNLRSAGAVRRTSGFVVAVFCCLKGPKTGTALMTGGSAGLPGLPDAPA
jgi:hypothetical protein